MGRFPVVTYSNDLLALLTAPFPTKVEGYFCDYEGVNTTTHRINVIEMRTHPEILSCNSFTKLDTIVDSITTIEN